MLLLLNTRFFSLLLVLAVPMFHVQNNEINTDRGNGKKEKKKKNNCSYDYMGCVQAKLNKRYAALCLFFSVEKKLSSSLLLVDEMRTIGLVRFRCFFYIDR